MDQETKESITEFVKLVISKNEDEYKKGDKIPVHVNGFGYVTVEVEEVNDDGSLVFSILE